MIKFFYQLILYFCKFLILVKRGIVGLFSIFWSVVESISSLLRSTLGVRFYKWSFRIKKIFSKLRFKDKGLVDVLGSRGFLQLLFFLIAILIALPHSKLYTEDIAGLAGRDTILYSLIGPGDQNFEIQEITANFSYIQPKIENKWNQGAISLQTYRRNRSNNFSATPLVATNIGGVVKPNILDGPKSLRIRSSQKQVKNQNKTNQADKESKKLEGIFEYEIKPGDTLYSLANQFGISVNTLVWANDGVSRQSYLQPGNNLTILPVSGVLHEVESGNTIGGIAQVYDADIEDIVEYNDLSDNNIQVGQRLVIPHGEINTTPREQEEPKVAQNQTNQQSRQESEKKQVSQSREQTTQPEPTNRSSQGYIWPTEARNITQYFGWRHTGLDIADNRGTSLYAARSGRVVKSECGWNGGYGCYVIIQHEPGIRTLYAHAYKLYVQKGQRVKQGETVAAMGSTGRSTGPHIHFEVRINGQRKNPLQFIR
jgi:murein DD-endopeptidase MepM/ murein hydrolase activator NlpD